MKIPRLLLNPVMLIHAWLWCVVIGLHVLGELGIVEGAEAVVLMFLAYSLWGLSALAAAPVCFVTLRRGVREHDMSLIVQSSAGALAACSVLAYGFLIFYLASANPR